MTVEVRIPRVLKKRLVLSNSPDHQRVFEGEWGRKDGSGITIQIVEADSCDLPLACVLFLAGESEVETDVTFREFVRDAEGSNFIGLPAVPTFPGQVEVKKKRVQVVIKILTTPHVKQNRRK